MSSVTLGCFQWETWNHIEHLIPAAIVSSNVTSLHEVRVIYLLQDHEGSIDHLIQQKFNQIIIKTLYCKGDTLLVEDDASKCSEELSKREMTGFKTSDYHIEGWDNLTHSLIIQEALKELRQSIDEAVTKTKNVNSSKEECLQAYRSLIEFILPPIDHESANQETEDFVYSQLPPSSHQAFSDKWSTRIKACYQAVHVTLLNLMIYSTFEARQNSLKSCTERHLNHSTGKVFAVMGPRHGIALDPLATPTAQEFLPSLNCPYAIIHIQRKTKNLSANSLS